MTIIFLSKAILKNGENHSVFIHTHRQISTEGYSLLWLKRQVFSTLQRSLYDLSFMNTHTHTNLHNPVSLLVTCSTDDVSGNLLKGLCLADRSTLLH